MAFGWFSVFLFMVLAALSPSAVYDYQHVAGNLFGPAINAALGESPPAWLEGAAEAILIIVAFGMPELLISLAGCWLIGRSGSRIRVEPRVVATNLSSSGQPC